jgi:hypothetical protein
VNTDSHIAPSKHSTKEVDEKLEEVENKIEDAPGAGSPAIKPSELAGDGKAVTDTPRNPNA